MTDNLVKFRTDFLNANSWEQRKDGVPLNLLDNLSDEEKPIAEKELINVLSLKDTWPIIGLGHIKSIDSLPILYKLFSKSKKHIKIILAHSIFRICGDIEMIKQVLIEIPKVTNTYEIIDILYILPDFGDERINKILKDFCDHKEYLIAYNATRALGLSTDAIVDKFRNK
jgi:hypothetical protein